MSVKNLIEIVKANKNVIIKKTLIIGGSAVALALTAGLVAGHRNDDDVFVIDETIEPELDDTNL